MKQPEFSGKTFGNLETPSNFCPFSGFIMIVKRFLTTLREQPWHLFFLPHLLEIKIHGMYLNNAVELFMSKTPFIILNYLFVMSYLFNTGQNKVYPLTKG